MFSMAVAAMPRRRFAAAAALALSIRTLALRTRSRGALRGANDRRCRATPGHMQPRRVRPSGTSGCIRHRPATLRKCLLSSRSRVRVAVGAQIMLVVLNIRNYDRSIEALLAGNHSIRYITFRMSRRVRAHQAELRPRHAPQRWSAARESMGEPAASAEADAPRLLPLTRLRPHHLHRDALATRCRCWLAGRRGTVMLDLGEADMQAETAQHPDEPEGGQEGTHDDATYGDDGSEQFNHLR